MRRVHLDGQVNDTTPRVTFEKNTISDGNTVTSDKLPETEQPRVLEASGNSREVISEELPEKDDDKDNTVEPPRVGQYST